MKSRFLVLFSLFIILSMLFAACAPAPAPVEEAPAAEEAAPTEPPAAAVPATEAPAAIEAPTEAPAEPVVVKGGDLIIATRASAEPASFDGHIDPYQSTWLFNSFVADSLIMTAPDGTYQPALATEWEQSEDGLSWTFKLRDDVTFQDDTPFNAEAVKYNFERVCSEEVASAQLCNDVGPITSIDVIDEFTIKINHETPWAAFQDAIRRMPLWSPTAAEQYGVADFDKHLVGTGPFLFTEWVPNDHVTFTRWDGYGGWNPVQMHEGPAYLNTVTIKFIGEDAVLGSMVDSGDAHVVQELPATYVVDYEDNPDAGIMAGYQAGTGLQMVMNTTSAPLDQIQVRQALHYASDRVSMNDLLYDGLYLPDYGPLNSVHPCFNPDVESVYPYDPEKAKALLEEAGWKDEDGDGVREAHGVPGVEDGKPLDIRFTVLHHQEIGEALQQQWKDVGINLLVEVVAGPIQLDMVQKRDFELMYERQRTPDPRVLDQVWNSKGAVPGGWAWSGWVNPELDAILEQVASLPDYDQRCELAKQAQSMIMEYAPQLGTLSDPVFYAVSNSVKDFTLGAEGNWFFLNDTYIEE